MIYGYQQNALPPGPPQCSWRALAYCCCQDLLPEVNFNPRFRRPAAVNYQADMRLRKELWDKFPALRKKARKKGFVINRPAWRGTHTRSRGEFPTAPKLRILGKSLKVEKGEGRGVVTAILYLSPEKEAWTKKARARKGPGFKGLCPHATKQCAAACLGHAAGQLSTPGSRSARAWKTIVYLLDRKLFTRMVDSEIADFEKKVRALGKVPAIRLDGSTDTGMAVTVQKKGRKSFVEKHPGVRFYDYTKDFDRMEKFLDGEFPENFHLTYSYAGEGYEEPATYVLRKGGNVAVVFESDPFYCDPLPAFWYRFPVIDADADDVRFYDEGGTVAGLRFKQAEGRPEAMRKAEGFVQPPGGPPRVTEPTSKAGAKREAVSLRATGYHVHSVDEGPEGWFVRYSLPTKVVITPEVKVKGPFSKVEADKKVARFLSLGLKAEVRKGAKRGEWFVHTVRESPEDLRAVRRLPVLNPRALHELRVLLGRKEVELDDAIFFKRAADEVAGLRQEIEGLKKELGEAEAALEAEIKQGLRQTRHDIQWDEWRYRKNPRLRGAPANPYRNNPLLAIVGNPHYRNNPLLAIVGNPGPVRGIGHHRRAAMDLIHQALEHEDFRPLRQAHEHLQAAYRCCSNPPHPADAGVLDEVLAEIDRAEDALFAGMEEPAGRPRKKARKAVAGSGKRGRVKKKRGGVRKNKPKAGKPRKKRYSLEEAREKFDGFDEAEKAYKRFHGREPGHVDVYELEDGEDDVTTDPVHAALHRTLETNYIVPWDSNKRGSLWKHEHLEGALEGKINIDARMEDLPLEVFDVKRNRTIKLPNGRWQVTDWWREKAGRGERRRH